MSITICEENHDAVVYNDYSYYNKFHKCPVCEALRQVVEFKKENSDLRKKLYFSEQNNRA